MKVSRLFSPISYTQKTVWMKETHTYTHMLGTKRHTKKNELAQMCSNYENISLTWWKKVIFEIYLQALLAPSSVEILNFWQGIARRLKLSQNNVLMRTSFCQNFSLLAPLCQKLKISTLDGAKTACWKISKITFLHYVKLIFSYFEVNLKSHILD